MIDFILIQLPNLLHVHQALVKTIPTVLDQKLLEELQQGKLAQRE